MAFWKKKITLSFFGSRAIWQFYAFNSLGIAKECRPPHMLWPQNQSRRVLGSSSPKAVADGDLIEWEIIFHFNGEITRQKMKCYWQKMKKKLKCLTLSFEIHLLGAKVLSWYVVFIYLYYCYRYFFPQQTWSNLVYTLILRNGETSALNWVLLVL